MNDVPTKSRPPYLFLDVDGVLNSAASSLVHGGPGNPNNPTRLDEIAVGLVAELTEKTEAHLVISSTWRGGGPAQFAAWMANYGWHNCPVIGETPPRTNHGWDGSSYRPRGALIREWLQDHAPGPLKSEEYLILDDNGDAGETHPDYCFVETDSREGFRWSKYRESVRKLSHRDTYIRYSSDDA